MPLRIARLPLRVLALLINTLFSYYWDIVHDWDLGHTDAANTLLRDQLLFRSPSRYYGAMVVNLVLRFSWGLRLSTHVRLHDDLRYDGEQGILATGRPCLRVRPRHLLTATSPMW